MTGDWTVGEADGRVHTFTDEARALVYAREIARVDRPTHVESPDGRRWLIVAEHPAVDVWAMRRLA